MNKQNTLDRNKNMLIYTDNTSSDPEYNYLLDHFFGVSYHYADDTTVICATYAKDNTLFSNKNIYLCGDIGLAYGLLTIVAVPINSSIYVIKDFSTNYDDTMYSEEYSRVSAGHVPINIHNVGVYFRSVLEPDVDYFDKIKNEHEFQTLTESTKPNNAFRKGIYLSEVLKNDDELCFNLLRCSANLGGPTDNFRETDKKVIEKVNIYANNVFSQKSNLNHVLAQIYENSEQAKAKIKAHSDKTKDMPENGTMAFCTFYESFYNNQFNDVKHKKLSRSKKDMFDFCYNETSVFTKLYFKLKSTVNDRTLVNDFEITLYPNSVFFIPLSTNRLYTHEIRPYILPYDVIPTRMGYVVRCSKTNVVYKDGQTYIKKNDIYTKLGESTKNDMAELRTKYYKENVTDEFIEYGDVHFSMNMGDYIAPIY